MDKSEKLDLLIPALIAAQRQFKPVTKNSENPFHHSRYANLETCIEATKEALQANGLVVVQHFVQSEGGSYGFSFRHQTVSKTGQPESADIQAPAVCLQTTLLHVSGQWIGGSQTLTPAKPDPQGFKAASTYARRSALLAILGIAEEDDDGEEASGRSGRTIPSLPARSGEAQTFGPLPKPVPRQTSPQASVGEMHKVLQDVSDNPPEDLSFDDLPATGGMQGESGEIDFAVKVHEKGPLKKTGKNARGQWTCYSMKVNESDFGSTFDKKAGAFLEAHAGQSVVLSCNRTERGYDIVGWGEA